MTLIPAPFKTKFPVNSKGPQGEGTSTIQNVKERNLFLFIFRNVLGRFCTKLRSVKKNHDIAFKLLLRTPEILFLFCDETTKARFSGAGTKERKK